VRRTIRKSTWAEIRTAYASGIGLRNIDIPEGTILARAKREDVLPTITSVEAVAMSMQRRGERHIERMAGVSERAVDHIGTMDGPEILNSVDQIENLDKVARRTFGLNDNPYSGFTLNILNINSLNVDQGQTLD
jgi:hypothetical protein